MAKRGNNGNRQQTAENTKPTAGTAETTDAVEERVVAFAEQLGRIAGTVQARAEGWMDREALKKQISGVRDSAAELLDHLKTTVTGATSGNGKGSVLAARLKSRGRSGGIVDAPGKKHRKPAPIDPRAAVLGAKRAATQAGSGMKTMKKRGRG